MGILNAPPMQPAYRPFVDIHRRTAEYLAKVVPRAVSEPTYIGA